MTKAYKELQGINETDLQDKLREIQKDSIKLRAQVAIGTVPKNALQIRNNKRMVARILTLINQKKLAAVTEKPVTLAATSAPVKSKNLPKAKTQKTPKEEPKA